MKKLSILSLPFIALISSSAFANPQNDTIPIKQSDPFSGMASMFEQMSRNFFNDSGFMPPAIAKMQGLGTPPRADVYENKDDIIVKIDLPGVDKNKIKLEVFQDYISLKYEEETKRDKKNDTYHVSERRYGSFQRVIPIPHNGNIEDADSEYKDGVLTITIPKSEDVKPKSKVLDI
ncbi:MAG TPA: hypothetical protein DIV86_03160 [Alphaproteobacteria bacterium]|nr:hypothetical protein [Alphaproteobacteria bacterium]